MPPDYQCYFFIICFEDTAKFYFGQGTFTFYNDIVLEIFYPPSLFVDSISTEAYLLV